MTGEVSINEIKVPSGAPLVGQVAVAVTGTAVQFTATATHLPGGTVLVTANSGNAAAVAVGGSGVTNTVDGTGNGLVIEAGETAVVLVKDLSDLYVNGTGNDWVTYTAG